jgi:hypothetical protein
VWLPLLGRHKRAFSLDDPFSALLQTDVFKYIDI